MSGENLRKAKEAKNDEFYTQYSDIQSEINAYIEFNPDTFRDKVVLCPCDDPEWSNFTKFFAQNFEYLGLKKLISTGYAIKRKEEKYGGTYQMSLFEEESPQFDRTKSRERGRIFTLTREKNAKGRIDYDALKWSYLKGDGDFRSDEVKKLRDEADIIVTNPPFSLYREFVAWLVESGKKYLVLSNKNSITYKEVFPLIMSNQMWSGVTKWSREIYFDAPDHYINEALKNEKDRTVVFVNGRNMTRSQVVWFTNIDHGRRHTPIPLMTMEENLKYSKHKEIRERGYVKYDNYDAIDVPFTDAIPSDYYECMGVPISFLEKYCPEQFDIVAFRKGADGKDLVISFSDGSEAPYTHTHTSVSSSRTSESLFDGDSRNDQERGGENWREDHLRADNDSQEAVANHNSQFVQVERERERESPTPGSERRQAVYQWNPAIRPRPYLPQDVAESWEFPSLSSKSGVQSNLKSSDAPTITGGRKDGQRTLTWPEQLTERASTSVCLSSINCNGVMGVPISFLEKWCPEQFEIIGCTESEGRGFSNGLWNESSGIKQALINGERVYKRIFIKRKQNENNISRGFDCR